ncbi:hypothetical protein [Halostagnicola sp. A56]|uniref:hypothetical protein n=1 Tax=Halostagnicola sp. A56 TaxID=1495067 RepID=UPI0012E1F784|nr:hypothetical protein [Halostagnicola sp. A56]
MTKVAAVVGIAILMVLAPMAGVAGATTIDGDTQPEEVSLVSEDNEYKVSDNVSVWKGSPISLRADLEKAETNIQLHNIRMETPDGMGVDARLKNAGVFGTGDIPLDLEEADGPQISDYKGKDANLVVGQLNSEGTIDDRELLTSFDRDSIAELNNNVEFEVESIELNSSGEFSGAYDANEAGQWASPVQFHRQNHRR